MGEPQKMDTLSPAYLDVEVLPPQEGITVLRLSGEIDISNAEKLRAALKDAIEKGKSRLIVNLEWVSYIDSIGIGVLLGALKKAKEAGGDICLSTTRRQMRRILQLTNLEVLLHVYGTEAEAMEKHFSLR